MDNQMLKEIERTEPPIQNVELIEEILPLVKEYFIGDVSFDGQSILYRLPNGQKFKIIAEAV